MDLQQNVHEIIEMRASSDVADSCRTRAATNVIFGLALGYKSVIIPIFSIAVAIYVSFSLAAMYGIAVAALGMLSTIATGLAIDAYGPISDNAGGIAEMPGMSHSIRERTDALDAAGNTTAAIGKEKEERGGCLVGGESRDSRRSRREGGETAGLGTILFSKLNAKYYGNPFTSSTPIFISLTKYSNFGPKLFTMMYPNMAGNLPQTLAASSYVKPILRKNLIFSSNFSTRVFKRYQVTFDVTPSKPPSKKGTQISPDLVIQKLVPVPSWSGNIFLGKGSNFIPISSRFTARNAQTQQHQFPLLGRPLQGINQLFDGGKGTIHGKGPGDSCHYLHYVGWFNDVTLAMSIESTIIFRT
ncbi:hypothetical protein RJ640_019166 [Escallonia rubra]|uniref:H(+)-exporting diphosphatase n=1 Tax=Escallonia rubra TaxID=112253 RepID=A0AA88UH66_9ASTE|nr:hypothetical protein RJ640_019166 [Escallonia rubra]